MDNSGDYSKGHFVRQALYGIEGNKFEVMGWTLILIPLINAVFLQWTLYSWLKISLLVAIIMIPWIKRQHTLFVRGQLMHRHSPRVQVVYTPNDPKCLEIATNLCEEAEKSGYRAKMTTVLDYPAYHCLNNALILLFVINDSEESQRNFSDDRYLAQWMHAEIQTRVYQSDYLGYRANIVYTREGQRRNCFLRLKYSVISVGENSHPAETPFSYQIDSNFSEFGAYRVLPMASEAEAKEWVPKLVKELDNVVVNPYGTSKEMQNKVKNAEPLLNAERFAEYLLACPCCKTYDLEKTRERPSKWRLSLLDFILFGLFHNKGHNPIGRFTKGYIEGKLFPINRVRFLYYYLYNYMYPPVMQDNGPPPPLTTVLSTVAIHPELGRKVPNESSDRDSELPLGEFIVNPTLKFTEKYSVLRGKEYIHEFTHPYKSVAMVTDPATQVPYYYDVPQDAVGIMTNLKPGVAPPSLTDLAPAVRKSLYDSSILIRKDQLESDILKWNAIVLETSMDLQKKGWCVFKEIFHPYFFKFVQEYYAGIAAEFYKDSPQGVRKFYTWNDEPLARYFNYHFTDLVSRVTGERLCHSSLALSIWIHEGPGFLIHTDTNPPFDITLDVVINHHGATGRSLNFVKKPLAGQMLPEVETLNLKVGESILFKGSEIPHFGGNLPADHQHTVMLFTWEYVRD